MAGEFEGDLSQYREINRQLSRARRMDYRRAYQTRDPEPPPPTEDPLFRKAKLIAMAKEYKEMKEKEVAHLTPEERDRYEALEEMNYLRRLRTKTMKISYSQELDAELLDKMQRLDPEFMTPIREGLKRRPARQQKAERAIQQRGITSGVDDYMPLWER